MYTLPGKIRKKIRKNQLRIQKNQKNYEKISDLPTPRFKSFFSIK